MPACNDWETAIARAEDCVLTCPRDGAGAWLHLSACLVWLRAACEAGAPIDRLRAVGRAHCAARRKRLGRPSRLA